MNFWQIFVRVLPWRPGAAVAALWWQLSGRRVRARNRLRAAGARLPFAYKLWMRNVERQSAAEQAAKTIAGHWRKRPRFLVLVDARNCSQEEARRSTLSVERQTYAEWQLVTLGACAGRNEREAGCTPDLWRNAVGQYGADWVVPLVGGDQLSSSALFHFAEELQSSPDALIIFGDEDHLDVAGRRCDPWFKPRWNEELFLALDYISRACAINARAVQSATAGGTDDGFNAYCLLLRVLEADRGPIVHVPRIIAHVRDRHAGSDQSLRTEAVGKFVAPRGGIAAPGSFGSVKVTWPLPSTPPLVSIIVPTKDKLEILRPCIESVIARTSYDPFELLIVDNGSVERQTLSYLENIRGHQLVRVLNHPLPYSYSAINNHAATEAAGEYLCLLNNDTEVLEENWLTEMMRYAVRSEIGAVGAKLLYPDGTIQHAGVVVGIGDAAGHAHRHLPSHERGYFGQPHTAQFVSAVTGACLLVDKEKFFSVGGLDEELLPIAYNDVDLCLKLQQAGWRNVYVPHALLVHHESKSRARDNSPQRIKSYQRELKAFQERWNSHGYDDPQLNPNLDRSSETFVIRF